MIKTIINLVELVIIVRLLFGAVRLMRGKNKGILGKTVLLIKRGINKRLDKALKRQQILSGKNVVEFKKYRRMKA